MSKNNDTFWNRFHKHIDAEKNGVWVNLFGSRFKMRLFVAKNREFVELVNKDEDLKKSLDNSREDYSYENCFSQIIGKFALVDWENFQDQKTSQEIPFSREKAIEIMKEHPELAMKLQELAIEKENEYYEGLESTKKK